MRGGVMPLISIELIRGSIRDTTFYVKGLEKVLPLREV